MIIIESKGFVDITEDDYEQGALDFVNQWDFDVRGTYDTLDELLSALNRELPWKVDADNVSFYDGYLRTEAMVDNDNYQADDSDIESWKRGETKLYIADAYVPILVGDVHTMTDKEAEEFGITVE